MEVVSFLIKYHYNQPGRPGERVFKVFATVPQLTELRQNADSKLWLDLQGPAMEKLGLRQPGLFGRIILQDIGEKKFREKFLEIDITDVPVKLAPAFQKNKGWLKKLLKLFCPNRLATKNDT